MRASSVWSLGLIVGLLVASLPAMAGEHSPWNGERDDAILGSSGSVTSAFSRVNLDTATGGVEVVWTLPTNRVVVGQVVFTVIDSFEMCLDINYVVTEVELADATRTAPSLSNFYAYESWTASHRRLVEAHLEALQEARDNDLPLPPPVPPQRDVEPCDDAVPVAPDMTEALVAAGAYLDQLELGVPVIEPGRAITGVEMFLQTGRELEQTTDSIVVKVGEDYSAFPVVTDIMGDVSLTAQGAYTVDWGDGTVTGPHHVPGGPFPGDGRLGAVTHTYVDTNVDGWPVTVTDVWTVELRVEFLGDTLVFPLVRVMDPSEPLLLPTREVRSVRTE